MVDGNLVNLSSELAKDNDLLQSFSRFETTTSVSKSKPTINPNELAALEKDIQSYNNDISLLSTLLGRPIKSNDLSSLTKQYTKPPVTRPSFTTRSTLPTTTAFSSRKPDSGDQLPKSTSKLNDVDLLQELLLKNDRAKSLQSSQALVVPEFYGKSNEAVLAAILKQQGIGPTNTDLKINVNLV